MEQTKEELLEYARMHYPIGTQYVPAHVNIGVNEVTDTQYRYSKDSDEYIHVGGKHILNDYNYCIYANGKWAEIVKHVDPMLEIQRQAKEKFPIGCNFTNTEEFSQVLLEDICTYTIHGKSIWAHDSAGYLYDNGKWATLIEINYKELQNKAWEVFKHVKEGDKYIDTRGKERIAIKDAVKTPGSEEFNCYIDCGPGFLWEIQSGKELYAKLLPNQNMKYELGKIKFKGKKPEDQIPKYYTNDHGIPTNKIVHGNTILNKNYEYAEIVDFYNEYYIVEYLDKLGKYVTLAFKEDVLEPYIEQPKEKWIPKVGDWVVSLEDRGHYRKKGDVFQVVAVDGNSIYYKEDVNGTTSTFRPAEPHEIPLVVMEYKEPPTKVKVKSNSEEIKIQIKKSKTIKI